MQKSKKGQVSLGNAPTIVLIVGLTFLIMATVALVSEKYNEAMPLTTYTVTNESLTPPTAVAAASNCNFQTLTITEARNSTAAVIAPVNYTVSGAQVINTTALATATSAPWQVDYTYQAAGVACNVTNDLNTEIQNNTSIAGIVLTISLVGIVLSVLIGVFVGMRKGI